jgi:para-nitrobenzyl esterase
MHDVVALIYPEPITSARYQALLGEFFGDAAAAAAERYPLHAYASPGQAWAAIMTDREHAGPEQLTTHLLAQHVPVYAYEFTDRGAPGPAWFPAGHPVGRLPRLRRALPPPTNRPDRRPQAAHARAGAPVGPDDRLLVQLRPQRRPNAKDLPAWPRFDEADEVPYMQGLAAGEGDIGRFDRAAEHQLGFWAGLS